MSKHNNLPANGDFLLKDHDIRNNGNSSSKLQLPLAAGLPDITHIPLHLDFDSTSDARTTIFSRTNSSSPTISTVLTTTSLSPSQQGLSSSTSQSQYSSSSSLPTMIVDEPHESSNSNRHRLDFHATRRSPGPRGVLDRDYSLHDESPFEAARRAQRKAETAEERLPKDAQPYIPGKTRFPSIKPGEIVPHHLIWTIVTPPTFTPPLEAPPFPPDVGPFHNPIRPAHFPQSTYQVSAKPPELNRMPSRIQPPFSSSSPAPVASQNNPPPYPPTQHSSVNDFQSPSSNLQRPGPQPLRGTSPVHSSRSAPVPQQAQPPPLVRSNTDTLRDIPPNHRANGGLRQREAPMPLTIPQGPLPPQPKTAPPMRAPSLRQYERPPLPPSLTPAGGPQQHLPPRGTPQPTRPAIHSSHQPHTPSPLHADFVPANPVRLPSENFRMAQSDHGHGVPDRSFASDTRAIRSTPKPVMPQLLAPSANKETRLNVDEKNAANLTRSISGIPSKGGFLSKTKSLLRKRTSTSAITLNTDGSIGFNTLAPLNEEGGGKPPSSIKHKLSKRR